MKKIVVLPISAALILSGCSSFSLDRKVDYRSAKPGPSLELPPDIKSTVFENHYIIPDNMPGSTPARPAIASTVTSSTETTNTVAVRGDVATVIKSGQQRWLSVNLSPEQTWKIAHDFWIENGFVIEEEHPQAGVMETNWAENRAKIPQDIIRRTIGKVLDMLYSTAERDRFRTRLERSASSGSTELYISHKGMIEVADSATDAKVYKWQPRPADPELEAEMLQRLAVKFNHPNDPVVVRKSKDDNSAIAPVKEEPEQAHIIKNNQEIALQVDDDFESAWQRTSVAVEHLGFTLEDRNRQQGIFVLRYSSDGTSQKKGWADRLSFWKSDPKTRTATYRLHAIPYEKGTRLVIENAEGQLAPLKVAEPILSLLHAQLR